MLARTPLQPSKRLSDLYGARVLLKREDLQEVRSFKIRGAYNKIARLTPEEAARGVVCASAGNHAQGVAFACAALGIRATVFMPAVTPLQKIERVQHFGKAGVAVHLVGDCHIAAGLAEFRRPAEPVLSGVAQPAVPTTAGRPVLRRLVLGISLLLAFSGVLILGVWMARPDWVLNRPGLPR